MSDKFVILGVYFLSLLNITIQHFDPIYNACLHSKSCNHTGINECGRDAIKFDVRMFIDECDRIEYNCDNKKEYYKTNIEACQLNIDNSTYTKNENLTTTERDIQNYTYASLPTSILENSTKILLTVSAELSNVTLTTEFSRLTIEASTNATLKNTELTIMPSITTEKSTTQQLTSNTPTTSLRSVSNTSTALHSTTNSVICSHHLSPSLILATADELTTVQITVNASSTSMEPITTEELTTLFSFTNESTSTEPTATEKSTIVQFTTDVSITSMKPTINSSATSMEPITSPKTTTFFPITNKSTYTEPKTTEKSTIVQFTTNVSTTSMKPTINSSATVDISTTVQLPSKESTTKTSSETYSTSTLTNASSTVSFLTNASFTTMDFTTTPIQTTHIPVPLSVSTIFATTSLCQITVATNETNIQEDCSRMSKLSTTPFTAIPVITNITENTAEKFMVNLNNVSTPSYHITGMDLETTIKSTIVVTKLAAEIAANNSTVNIDHNTEKIFNMSSNTTVPIKLLNHDINDNVINTKDITILETTENTTEALTTSHSIQATCVTYPTMCNRPVTWETTSEGENRDFFQILKEKFGRRAIHLKDTTHYKPVPVKRVFGNKSFLRGPHNES